jgi:hypothetical protein
MVRSVVPPPLDETTQALGICFTGDRRIVLVTWNGEDWSLPGGTPEPGETLEQALGRGDDRRSDPRAGTGDRDRRPGASRVSMSRAGHLVPARRSGQRRRWAPRHSTAPLDQRDFPSSGGASSGAGCGAPGAAVLASAFGDGVLEAGVVDGGVDGGGADVGVAGELADHADVGTGAGEGACRCPGFGDRPPPLAGL